MSGLGVSVAMATFNGGSHLVPQLESLARQTLLPIELVVTDDGSIDSTGTIVAEFATRAPFPVRWHPNPERLGYRGNFMRAAGLCRGELVAFCDQDDVWHANKLAVAVEAFADPDVLLFHHDALLVDASGVSLARHLSKPIIPPPRLNAFENPPWAFSQGFTQVFRARLLGLADLWPRLRDYVGGPSQTLAHDQFYFFLASVFGSVVYSPDPLVDYRQHGGNVFGTTGGQAGWRDRLRAWLENRAPAYAMLSEVADRAADALRSAADKPDLPFGWQRRAREGGERYAALAELYRLRADAYASGSVRRRWGAWVRLRDAHAYDEAGCWTFGTKAATKDFGLGVLLGPLLARHGFPAGGGDPMCRAGSGSSAPGRGRTAGTHSRER